MAELQDREPSGGDWAAGVWSYLPAWLVPKVAIVATAFASVPVRTGVWIAALIWMGLACILNARRCGRVHCRYTGPYYLALTVPVLLGGLGKLPPGATTWFILGGLSVFGGLLIAWATEAAWGRYEKRKGSV